MSKEILRFTGETFPVGVKFSAKPGDRIVIVNGICLGTYDETPSSAVMRAPYKKTEERNTTISVTENDIVEALKTLGPTKTEKLGHHFNIATSDAAARNVLGYILRTCEKKGFVRNASHTRYALWEVAS